MYISRTGVPSSNTRESSSKAEHSSHPHLPKPVRATDALFNVTSQVGLINFLCCSTDGELRDRILKVMFQHQDASVHNHKNK